METVIDLINFAWPVLGPALCLVALVGIIQTALKILREKEAS